MKYMGSKARIIKDILPIMLDNEHKTFVDLFMGGCSVVGNVPSTYRRIANDKNKYLVAMFKSLVEGKEFPESIPRELYNDVRDCWHGKNDRYQDDMVGWVGFMASFNGRFFDGGYSGHNVVGKNGKSRDYIKEQISNTRSELDKLMGVEFHDGDYQDLDIPDKSIIYCDIAYRNTKQYDVSRNFDYERFYSWCKEKAKEGHKVFISEYDMPEDFTCVWQKQVTNSLNPTRTKRPIEKLFTIMEKKETYYIGDEHGTHYFTIEDGKVVETEVTMKQLQVFIVYAKKLGFKVGKL